VATCATALDIRTDNGGLAPVDESAFAHVMTPLLRRQQGEWTLVALVPTICT
jgi:hypothetical protein